MSASSGSLLETVAVLAIVAGAALFVALRFLRAARSRRSGTCACSCGGGRRKCCKVEREPRIGG